MESHQDLHSLNKDAQESSPHPAPSEVSSSRSTSDSQCAKCKGVATGLDPLVQCTRCGRKFHDTCCRNMGEDIQHPGWQCKYCMNKQQNSSPGNIQPGPNAFSVAGIDELRERDAPFLEESKRTQGRNARKDDQIKLKGFQARGELPPDATVEDMHAWIEAGAIPYTKPENPLDSPLSLTSLSVKEPDPLGSIVELGDSLQTKREKAAQQNPPRFPDDNDDRPLKERVASMLVEFQSQGYELELDTSDFAKAVECYGFIASQTDVNRIDKTLRPWRMLQNEQLNPKVWGIDLITACADLVHDFLKYTTKEFGFAAMKSTLASIVGDRTLTAADARAAIKKRSVPSAFPTEPTPPRPTEPTPALPTEPTPALPPEPSPTPHTEPSPALPTEPSPALPTELSPALLTEPTPALPAEPEAVNRSAKKCGNCYRIIFSALSLCKKCSDPTSHEQAAVAPPLPAISPPTASSPPRTTVSEPSFWALQKNPNSTRKVTLPKQLEPSTSVSEPPPPEKPAVLPKPVDITKPKALISLALRDGEKTVPEITDWVMEHLPSAYRIRNRSDWSNVLNGACKNGLKKDQLFLKASEIPEDVSLKMVKGKGPVEKLMYSLLNNDRMEEYEKALQNARIETGELQAVKKLRTSSDNSMPPPPIPAARNFSGTRLKITVKEPRKNSSRVVRRKSNPKLQKRGFTPLLEVKDTATRYNGDKLVNLKLTATPPGPYALETWWEKMKKNGRPEPGDNKEFMRAFNNTDDLREDEEFLLEYLNELKKPSYTPKWKKTTAPKPKPTLPQAQRAIRNSRKGPKPPLHSGIHQPIVMKSKIAEEPSNDVVNEEEDEDEFVEKFPSLQKALGIPDRLKAELDEKGNMVFRDADNERSRKKFPMSKD
ncbi:hypothetical protein EJ08DRAFT_697185 [Tothia fuscella]|uniref:PHD-type domain-containing protein n=1 Tax=Tothia fuscella TaxID=1048955 RepID=A0A9P4NS74_9PEZI|nr:hypothetical protein EJ08DRAFT_697185 [Tothia fuscella]